LDTFFGKSPSVLVSAYEALIGFYQSVWSTDPACGRLEAQQEQEEDTRGAAPCSGSA
jgi:hypothetical protein